LTTPTGRQFDYVSQTIVDASGIATLSLPYSTEPIWPVKPAGAYVLRVGDARTEFAVSEAELVGGATIRVSP
jgi:hypothetical protein